jgi:hypothetical protein
MKVYYGVLLLLFTMISCDPAYYHNFYIKNSCEESIEINLYYNKGYAYPASGKPLTVNFVIECDNSKLIGSESEIGVFDDIRYYFDSIVIKKGDKIANVNYLDYSRWDSKKIAKYHTNSYLTINPEDFE